MGRMAAPQRAWVSAAARREAVERHGAPQWRLRQQPQARTCAQARPAPLPPPQPPPRPPPAARSDVPATCAGCRGCRSGRRCEQRPLIRARTAQHPPAVASACRRTGRGAPAEAAAAAACAATVAAAAPSVLGSQHRVQEKNPFFLGRMHLLLSQRMSPLLLPPPPPRTSNDSCWRRYGNAGRAAASRGGGAGPPRRCMRAFRGDKRRSCEFLNAHVAARGGSRDTHPCLVCGQRRAHCRALRASCSCGRRGKRRCGSLGTCQHRGTLRDAPAPRHSRCFSRAARALVERTRAVMRGCWVFLGLGSFLPSIRPRFFFGISQHACLRLNARTAAVRGAAVEVRMRSTPTTPSLPRTALTYVLQARNSEAAAPPARGEARLARARRRPCARRCGEARTRTTCTRGTPGSPPSRGR